MGKTNLAAKKAISIILVTAMVFSFFLNFSGAVTKAETPETNNNEEGYTEPDNGLPVVYLNIDEMQGTIDAMNKSVDHSVHCYGTLSIDSPDNFKYSDMNTDFGDIGPISMDIRGRGNSTWANTKKKPYKIKLDTKTDLLQRGKEYKNKHWVLVANLYDKTFVKDRMTAWLSSQMGFEFTPVGVPVDLVMTGQEYGTHYLGSYYLSENVRVDSNRLNIEELNENDNDLPTITGGYLVQHSLQVRDDSPDRFKTTRDAAWATHTPSFDTGEDGHTDSNDRALSLNGSGGIFDEMSVAAEGNEEIFNDPDPIDYEDDDIFGADPYKNDNQQQYIQNHMQEVEDAIYEGGDEYKDLIDTESTAKYWLINEFAINHDAFATSSTYIYKHRDIDGVVSKMMWGPVWDFDFAWYYDNDEYSTPLRPGHLWTTAMLHDKGEGSLNDEIYKQWKILKPALEELARDGGILDGYCKETAASAYADQELWDPSQDYNYENEIQKLKKWINQRLLWMDDNLSSIDNLIYKIQFTFDGEVRDTYFAEGGVPAWYIPDVPEKEGYVFIGWFDENGKEYDKSLPVTEDMTFTAKMIDEKEATKGQDIVLGKTCDFQKRGYYVKGYGIQYTVIPEDAQDKRVEWSSSDESFATVDNEGQVTYGNTGTGTKSVTLTAKLKNGVERSFVLTLTDDDEFPLPDSIYPESDVVKIKVGDQAGFNIKTKPDPSHINYMDFTSENNDVATVDERGVITAKGPGMTKINALTVTCYDDYRKEIECKTCMTVIVTEGIPKKYTVSFDVNGHGKAPKKQITEEWDKAVKPTDPKAPGYEFAGWYTTKKCIPGTEYDFNSFVTGNITLYAKWIEIKTVKMMRLYNPNSGEHFYTSSIREMENLAKEGWKYEGLAWNAPVKSDTPVYRLYNPYAGDHHYTISKDEKNNLVNAGWSYEGIGWYSDDAKLKPVYRAYNPNAVSGAHHFTISRKEITDIVKAGWKDEGIAFYSK